jgi:hypothetical protein
MDEDIKLTQGKYWRGSQVSFWPYALLSIFGLDHLLLRSPWTALYKFLSFIIPYSLLYGAIGLLCLPLCLFWYFYDIAQLGEWKLVKFFGIMTPMDHKGIGAGIFHTDESTPADKSIPSPFIYLLYVATSIVFVSLPVNKLVLGDIGGAMYQFVLLLIWPIAFAWGIYDIYRIFAERVDLFHKGQARIPPATLQVLRLNPITSWFYMDSYAKAENIGPDGEYTYVTMAKDFVINTANRAVNNVVKGVSGVTDMVAKEANKIQCDTPAPPAIPTQTGGTMLNNVSPAISSSVLLFSVGLLAFSGYVMYSFRKTYYKTTEHDDTPPDPANVRESSR